MVQRILLFSFYILFFLTPLWFLPYNNELFEYNKMMLVYALTVVVGTVWILKMLIQKRLILKKTPLDLPILIFFLSQFLSTFFSIDPHTSWWGYYSRSNGGLLSTISYLTLYFALVSNFSKDNLVPLLKSMMLGGLIVSLWAIPEHFGLSPSCVVLTSQFNADCWVQDVQARVFATLGQPNWLAAYLGMIIFPSIYFFLTAKNRLQSTVYCLLSTVYYLAFTFTYSRGAMLGFLAGMFIFVVLFFFERAKRVEKFNSLYPLGAIVGIFILVNLLFGSALTSFRLIRQSAPLRPSIASSNTQLETGGTESGQIRLIVWKGALEVFKHYPIFGSGVETFAYSYYNFRPAEHNNVSEWDFLYNKAHNEYLNYLATTGVLGFLSYLFLIGSFIVFSIKYLVLSIKKQSTQNTYYLLLTTLLCGYISYLVQNFFGFSVVMIALLFYLFPALTFLGGDELKERNFPRLLKKYLAFLPQIIYKRRVTYKIVLGLVMALGIYYLVSLGRLWFSDYNYKLGSDYTDAGNVGKGYNYLLNAVELNNQEPLYQSELGYTAAAASVALLTDNATESSRLKKEALEFTDNSLNISPKNVSLWRTAIRTYFQLSILDTSLEGKTLQVVDETIKMAPTDPKLYYNKALILSQLGRKKEAVEVIKEAIKLRPKYREAYLSLADFYIELGEKEKAREQLDILLKMIPNDPDGLKRMEEIQK